MIQLELDISLMEELIQSHQKLYKEYEQAIKSYDSTDVNSYRIVDDLVKGIDRKATENMDQLVVQIQALTQDRTEQMVQQEKEYIQTFNIKISSITIGSIGVIILITLVIALTYKNITRFIIELNRVMESVLRGDLTVRGEVSNKDELGDITIRFNEVLDNIQELLKESQDISGIVASSSFKVNQAMSEASQHISYTMMEITKGTREQSNQVRGSHESMVKVIDGIERVMTNMIQSESQVKVTQDVVDKGTQVLLQQRNKMNDTKGATERVEQVIEKLKLKSKEIGEVVIFINSITAQINLLSLNASIEAARAGESGRGFSVVANEIKKLADLSKQHTSKISALIIDVQRNIQNVDTEVQETHQSINQQEISLKSIEEVFERIRDSIERVAYGVKEVTGQTYNMHEAMDVMKKAMSGITKVIENTAYQTEDNMATMEEQTASIQEITVAMNYLSEQAEVLDSIIEKFKLV